MQIDTRVLGGLPVMIEFMVCPPEPDVGIMTSYVEIEGVYFYRHRKRKKPSVVTYPVPARLLKRIEEVEDLPGLVEQALSG